jgi:ABC-type multidrug transport system fused ATPase/permease subunit
VRAKGGGGAGRPLRNQFTEHDVVDLDAKVPVISQATAGTTAHECHMWAENRAARRVPDGPVSVEFDGVSFAYPSADKVSLASLEEVTTLDSRGGTEVLHSVSFRAEPGRMVALVGSSGAGKSTIAQLLPRLYDADAGSVRLRGCRATSERRRRTRPDRRIDPRDPRHGHPGRAPLP